jgi:hypothetical protein
MQKSKMKLRDAFDATNSSGGATSTADDHQEDPHDRAAM